MRQQRTSVILTLSVPRAGTASVSQDTRETAKTTAKVTHPGVMLSCIIWHATFKCLVFLAHLMIAKMTAKVTHPGVKSSCIIWHATFKCLVLFSSPDDGKNDCKGNSSWCLVVMHLLTRNIHMFSPFQLTCIEIGKIHRQHLIFFSRTTWPISTKLRYVCWSEGNSN